MLDYLISYFQKSKKILRYNSIVEISMKNRTNEVSGYRLSVKEIVEKLYATDPCTEEPKLMDQFKFAPTSLTLILEYIQKFGVSSDTDWLVDVTYPDKPIVRIFIKLLLL